MNFLEVLSSLPIKDYIVVGSAAIGNRFCKDIDVVCYKKDILIPYIQGQSYNAVFEYKGYIIDCLLADDQESLQKMLCYKRYREDFIRATAVLKAGHIIYDHPKWETHIADYTLLTSYMVIFDELDLEIVELHKKCTADKLKALGIFKPKPKLVNTTYEDFMNDAVVKHVDHDALHEAVAFVKGQPLYKSILKYPSTNSVECCESKFNSLTDQDKIKLVMEETMVIALERYIIPAKMAGESYDAEKAYQQALRKVCTSLSSNWFQNFAITNYFIILNSRIDYVALYEQNHEKTF